MSFNVIDDRLWMEFRSITRTMKLMNVVEFEWNVTDLMVMVGGNGIGGVAGGGNVRWHDYHSFWPCEAKRRRENISNPFFPNSYVMYIKINCWTFSIRSDHLIFLYIFSLSLSCRHFHKFIGRDLILVLHLLLSSLSCWNRRSKTRKDIRTWRVGISYQTGIISPILNKILHPIRFEGSTEFMSSRFSHPHSTHTRVKYSLIF